MFHRTARLFLRPQFAEDASLLARLERNWLAPGSDALVWLVTLPGEPGAPAIGTAHILETEDGSEISVWIAPAHRRQGYGSEALAALVAIARMLGRKLAKTPSFSDAPMVHPALATAGYAPPGKVPASFAGLSTQSTPDLSQFRPEDTVPAGHRERAGRVLPRDSDVSIIREQGHAGRMRGAA